MKYLKIILAIFLAFSFLSCSQKKEIQIIKTECPILRSWDFNTTIPSYKLLFKKDEKKYIIEEKEFENFFEFVKSLKVNLIKSIEILKLYKKQNEEFNALKDKK